MTFGKDFFKIFNFVIQLVRLIVEIFGDGAEEQAVTESKARSANDNSNEAC